MVPDQVIFLLVQDNIELACSAIEKAAMDRAVIDVDEGFAAAYELRRRHREVREASHLSSSPSSLYPKATSRSGLLGQCFPAVPHRHLLA